MSTPAAASSPQSIPEAETVRVMMAAIGLASTEVNVRASSSSTQENMKQKKAVTPMPERIKGMKMRTKNFGKGVAIDVRRFVYFTWHATHKAF